MVEKIKADNTSGASEFIEKVLDVIRAQLELIRDFKKEITPNMLELYGVLINCRPSMAPLINTIGYFIPEEYNITKEYLLKRLESFQEDRKKREKLIEAAFQSFIKSFEKENIKLMIISYSSTITRSLMQNQHLNMTFYILESRPLLEGRKVAEILSSKYETYLIVDAAIGKFIEKIDLVLVGIDSILSDGSIVNKIGTYPLACIARENKKKVYAVGDSFKYNLKSHYGQNVVIEGKPAEEIYDIRIKNELLKIRNYYFDKTPSKYIDGIISDLGVLSIPEFLSKIKTVLPIKWFENFLRTPRVN
jgi:translation initiation factor 2B subunit (eIF-2B alpha/beta/delta family)